MRKMPAYFSFFPAQFARISITTMGEEQEMRESYCCIFVAIVGAKIGGVICVGERERGCVIVKITERKCVPKSRLHAVRSVII